jgi:hypothetical protein
MKKISISSGFQRGGSLLAWDGQKFNRVQSAAENTWVGDGDSSFTTEVADDFKGAVVKFWGISSLSYCNSAELLGFSEEELKAPSPVKGWASCQGSCVRSTDDWRLETMNDYLVALARDASIFTVEQALQKGEKHPSGNGKVLVRLGLEAGDQAADAFAILDKDGNILTEVGGCGDRTPYPIQTEDGWNFSSSADDDARANFESEQEFWRVAEQIGVADQYRTALEAEYSESNNKLCAAIARRIHEAVAREEADSRADADESGILRRLLEHYRDHKNPLKSLRRENGGTWTFHRQMPTNVPLVGAEVFFGDNWWVVWVKK